jgi:hypothetical protein
MMPAPSAYPHNPSLPILECGLTAIAFASAFTRPRAGSFWFRKAERAFSGLAHRRGLAQAATGLSSIRKRAGGSGK